MMTDPIGDFFTRLRNAAKAGQEVVRVQHSLLKEEVAKLLKQEGYASDFEVEDSAKGKKTLSVTLKFQRNGEALLEHIRRISKPGHRVYDSAPKHPTVRQGIGFKIFSTSRGVMTDKQAIQTRVGGEVLGEVW